MICLDFKDQLADVLFQRRQIKLSELITILLQGISDDRGRAADCLLTNLSTFTVWGMIEREGGPADPTIRLTDSGVEQIERVREMRNGG